ncbi:type II toxin-antitoxin system VapC family toxin [Mesorhizobium ciceri]|uniref:PilT protein domain protein n=1 Tax=Mesorhizobium ciceri biovar biserrulae (strain HAMBI 2942 / LMG 23838 / WSM1271) TaxID=765698 RepID=E8TIF2_MESCW|nr:MULTISPECIES: type II toxin-antitoxin system VapC family toxin [Mesorhizobium]RUZ85082.1 type II toxin-antitoxin system VapC family toxin [Mesorhizobium sp. M7A.F.Ca.US.003.02.2.1]RVA55857.1 type II toxin-antitoxin system VapC family toxin [Mesorhizobium sp. M7A.F.Ca.US.001.01.1.1]ADV13654.1 PilT protein domain protein [Mesorhizobium ciceri biovar biserrulae WSM1271]AMX99893.1 twitching motility protein PilT [Mesorhizobium ciceri biovar biserrulae]ARP66253.1 PIN domain nuclease [Mesorhizobi
MSRRYLVDTHILLWVLNADSRLSDHHRDIFLTGKDVIVSAVSVAEIAIKKSLGKVTLTGDIVDILRSNGIPILGVNELHAARLEHLPLHHRDPFDRLLIAQTQIEGLTLVSADRQFSAYDVVLA